MTGKNAKSSLSSRQLVIPSSTAKIVAIGGGNGLSCLIQGLKAYTADITAIVAVTDEGGSSGRLRRGWGVLPPGDVRNCLVALAQDDALLSRLFQYRFPAPRQGKDWLEGHAFGNLFLTALTHVEGGFDRALAAAGHVLNIRGRVLPVSLEKIRLQARLADGRRVLGETRISQSKARIRRVSLLPVDPSPAPGVMAAIAEADLIVLGPGSLYTSVIPPLLVKGVAAAVARSQATRVYVCNVMTQPGESDGFSAADHLRALLDHNPSPGRPLVDAVLVNSRHFSAALRRHYRRSRSFPVEAPPERELDGVRLVKIPLVSSVDRASPGAKARHFPALLAQGVMGLHAKRKRSVL